MSNTDVINRYWGSWNDGPTVSAPPGCEVERVDEIQDTALTDDEKERIITSQRQAEREYANEKSGGGKIFKVIVNTAKNISSFITEGIPQYVEYLSEEPDMYTSKNSDLEFGFIGQQLDDNSKEVWDELYHLPLNPNIDFSGHYEVEQLINCYRQMIVENKEFAGKFIPVYLPPDEGYCFKNLRYQLVSNVDKCDGHGFTPPLINIKFAGIDLINARPIALASKDAGEGSDVHFTDDAIHEIIHSYGSLTEKPFMLNPDERLTEIIADKVVDHINEEYVGARIVLEVFPSKRTVSLDDQG